jgi:C1A family cysteine protease
MELLAIKFGKPRINFSRLFLYYAERVKIEGGDPADDSGAQIRDTMKSLATYGTCAETTWPYVSDKFSVNPSEAAWKEAMSHQILTYYRCIGLTGIRQCIAEGYSVVGGFSVPENMESDECAKTGIVKYPTAKEQIVGGHAAHFVAYDDKTQLLCFQNSWSTEWGDKGFGYLPYKFVTSGLASDFWTIRLEEF